ncbi:aldo/keto reductase [Asanoa sp. WMMD1127]|uniref:aldo/keto reductase n=1 Tax=Asanoa sp. WMMD1127 TaxID=3016107 RepID=UPI002417398C|nr:aldo/keto reductase [Asanoa sp. WMMD1127]MDG4824808.1 aldo/keto reductase [Asanoa sp. WMMD1127]
MMDQLVLGAMMFGTTTDERRAFAILDRFVDAGGRWIDTANCYAFWADESGFGGQSEALLGRWLARRPGVRDRVSIATKVGCEPLEANRFPETAEGLGAQTIKTAIEGSLRRLGTDRVEMYWAHRDTRRTPVEETVAAFGELVSAGLVGRLGCSNFATWRLERSRRAAADAGVAGYTAVQQHATYLQPRPGTRPTVVHRFGFLSDELVSYVESHDDMEIWSYTPLLSGAYTRPDKPLAPEYDHPGTVRRLAALDAVAAETGTTRNHVVLAWLTGGCPAIKPIVGPSTVAQLDDAIAAMPLRLTAAQRSLLDSAA